MSHHYRLRVYYEHTDAAGVVYHANYLSFFSQARVEWARARGFDIGRMHEAGLVLPVVRAELDYLAPALLDDELEVMTELVENTRLRLVFSQSLSRYNEPDKILCRGKITVISTDRNLKPRRMSHLLFKE